jgi:hypothetical protein
VAKLKPVNHMGNSRTQINKLFTCYFLNKKHKQYLNLNVRLHSLALT